MHGLTDAILARHRALSDADDDPTYDAVRNARDSYYEAIEAIRKERER